MTSAAHRRALALGVLVAFLSCARGAPPPRSAPTPPPSTSAPTAPAEPPAAAPPPTAGVAPEPPLAPPPEPPPPPLVEPRVIRVGLATDLAEVSFPCCQNQIVASADGTVVATAPPILVTPSATAKASGGYRVQAAALKDEGQARDLAARLQRITGQPADARFDAATDLYRVRVGRTDARPDAEKLQGRLSTLGMGSTWVVSEGAGIANAALRVTQAGKTQTVPGRWLSLQASGGGAVVAQGKRYRGRILVYLNDRGTLNLVNELPLEEYLRGVVPDEMGPGVYDELQALEAQAVAARTYTLRTLGEFASEGYDICATPRCQVYGGMDAEHPLSDRAVRETAGEVLLWQGQPADALYTSTCGGHTENVEVVFPLKKEPYLRGVPCYEAGLVRLAGASAAGSVFPDALTRELFPPGAGESGAAALERRLVALATRAGLAIPSDHLANLERREVQRFVGSLFDLALDARLFVAQEDVDYLVGPPPPGWSADDLRLAAYLQRAGFLGSDGAGTVDAGEAEALLFALARHLRLVREEEVHFATLAEGVLRVRRDGAEVVAVKLPQRLLTFRRAGERALGGDLAMIPGDRLKLYWAPTAPPPAAGPGAAVNTGTAPSTPPPAESLVAVIHDLDLDGAAHDRSSKWSSWTRFRSDRELAASVRTRFPGLDFASFDILSRGPSGRVAKLRLRGKDGSTTDVEGLAIRWTLDIPETLFTAKRVTSGGVAGWLFTGRGWGHGVGLCQVGAFGMARRGHDHREILEHYYPGVEIAVLPGAVPAAAPAAAAAAGRR